MPPGRCLPDGHHRHAHKSFLHITARLQGGGLLGDYLEDLKASPPRCSRHLTRTHRHRPGAVRLRSHEGDSAVSWGGRRGGAVGQSDRCEKLLSPLVTTTRYPWKQLEPALNTGPQHRPSGGSHSRGSAPSPSPQFCSQRTETGGSRLGVLPQSPPQPCPLPRLALGCSAEGTHTVLGPPRNPAQNLASSPPGPPHDISPDGLYCPRPSPL